MWFYKKKCMNGLMQTGKDEIMKAKQIIAVLGMTMILALAGCGSKGSVVEVTPTPAATPTPTEVPATVTPVPTSTPAPKVIGVKTSQAKYIYLTNSLQSDIREIYLMTSGGEDWGKNLIPSESSVKAAEQVQMYYTADSSSATDSSEDSTDTSSDTTTDTSSASTLYDMKIVTASGEAYQIYSVNLGDMEKASLAYDEESSVAYIRYMSLSEKKEKDTKENSQQTSSSDDSSEDTSYDDSSYDNYDDSSYDSSEDSSSDDSSYDDSSYDDSSYDDGSYDDSSYDDGSYDDSSYDDYADEGYDTDEEGGDWDY